MRTIAKVAMLALALTAVPAMAHGQMAPGDFELGLFADYTAYGKNAGCPCYWPANTMGVGGRATYGVTENIFFEMDATHARPTRIVTEGRLPYTAIRSTANAYLLIADSWGLSFVSGVGPLAAIAGGEIGTRFGVTGTTGMRYNVAGSKVLQAGVTGDYLPVHQNLNFTMRMGMSMVVSSKPTRAVPVMPAFAPSSDFAARSNEGTVTDQQTGTEVLTTPVYFDVDKVYLRADAVEVLEEKVRWLTANPTLRLRVEGNADESGTTTYNIPLGLDRAIEVVDFFVASGIPRHRFETISYGDMALRCTELAEGDGCDELNRRVDFKVIGAGYLMRRPPETPTR